MFPKAIPRSRRESSCDLRKENKLLSKLFRKKIVLASLAFALLAGLLASCSGDDATTGGAETPEPGPTTTAESASATTEAVTEGTEAVTEGGEAVELTQSAESRLQRVRERGNLICAGRNDVPGFGFQNDEGRLVGFDVDLCRAIATAVLGDPNAIEPRFITAAERGPTIQSGDVDALIRTVTWTTSRDAQWGNFAQTMFYDGQGFLVSNDLGISSALELEGASVCVTQGTTTELNLQDFISQNNLDIQVVTFEETDAAKASYEAGQCDSYTSDRSNVAAIRFSTDNPEDHVILPETISEEPLGPVVPHGDEQWFDIVKTVMSILIYAEAYGIESGNVPTEATGDPKVDRLLGFDSSFGQSDLGLEQTVAQDIIRELGNYGEIYKRNLGSDGIGLTREGSRNALWANAPCLDCPRGGQIYAAPLR